MIIINMTIVIPINFPLPAGLLTAAMSCAIVTFSAFFNKNPETAKHFGIFNINKVWRLLYHDLLSITDVETLTRLSDTLPLEGVPGAFVFGEGRGEVLDTRRAVTFGADALEVDG
jgi:hypothetical protein